MYVGVRFELEAYFHCTNVGKQLNLGTYLHCMDVGVRFDLGLNFHNMHVGPIKESELLQEGVVRNRNGPFRDLMQWF